jgi:hypothetical protein
VTPLLTKETVSVAKAVLEQHQKVQAAAAVAQGSGDGSAAASAGASDPGYDPAGDASSYDPSQGLTDPSGMPGDGSDVSGLSGLTLEGLAGAAIISTVWVAILDWGTCAPERSKSVTGSCSG